MEWNAETSFCKQKDQGDEDTNVLCAGNYFLEITVFLQRIRTISSLNSDNEVHLITMFWIEFQFHSLKNILKTSDGSLYPDASPI